MNDKKPTRSPTSINLHSKSRLLAIEFSDGMTFQLPCEYLRVFAKAKEVRTMENPVIGKESVNITQIEPQGQYAVRLTFDDGHDSSIYSWDTLYDLGVNQEKNWAGYQAKLKAMGYKQGDLPEAGLRRPVLARHARRPFVECDDLVHSPRETTARCNPSCATSHQIRS